MPDVSCLENSHYVDYNLGIMNKSKPVQSKLEEITRMEEKLRKIKDVDILLENILSCARKIVNADAGSIYEYDSAENLLHIRYSQNDTMQARLAPGEKLPYVSFSIVPTTQSISGYCALSKRIINIEDVYNLEDNILDEHGNYIERPFKFNETPDLISRYKTRSMLTIPLIVTNGKVLGVLQIINAQDEKGNIIPFDKDAEYYISQFAAKIGTIYEYAYLTRVNIDRLVRMAGFRDPRETGAHVERVSRFALEIYDRYAANKKIPMTEREKYRDS